MEWVVIVLPRYTQIVYQLLLSTKCVPHPYHIEGRYGSRTHEYYEEPSDDTVGGSVTAAVTVATEITSEPKTTTANDNAATTVNVPKRGRRMIGIPVLSEDHIYDAMKTNIELRNLFQEETTGDEKKRVVYLLYKSYTESKRAHEPPPFDAQIHVERRPTSSSSSSSSFSIMTTSDRSIRHNNNNNHTSRLEIKQQQQQQGNDCRKTVSFTYMEMFAGIGGFGVALEALGGQCLFCSEIDDLCRTVYATNLLLPSNSNVMHGDIYKVSDDALPKPGTIDLLVGGFPCQPFSSMGNQPGLTCPDGNLFLQIVRVLQISQPSTFLLENVPGLLRMTETIRVIVQALNDCGYNVTMEICDARCVTATTRKRLYIVGLRRQKQKQQQQEQSNIDTTMTTTASATTSKNDHDEPFQFPYIPDLGLRARDVIDYDLLDSDEEEIFRITDEQLHRLNTEKYWKPAHLAWPNTIIDTLVSHYGKSVARGHSQLVPGSAHSWSKNSNVSSSSNPRRFTPRECARLMGFPNSYILPPKTNVQQCDMAYNKEWYQMFGNAVCPPIIAAITGAILDRCPNIPITHQSDWIEFGRTIAVQLAYDAILPNK